MYNVAVDFTGT